jgi:hypothetical protein
MQHVAAFALAAVLGAGAAVLPAAAQAQDTRFYSNNMSGTTITHVYVSSVHRNDWGPDLLGAQVLFSGQRIFLAPPTCLNDIRVIYQGRRSQEWRGVDVCRITNFSIR